MSDDTIYKQVDYGQVIIKLKKIMDEKGYAINKVANMTMSKHNVIKRYYEGENMERVDLTILAKLCYVLKVEIQDLLEYIKPN